MGPSEQTPAVDRMPPHGTLAAQTAVTMPGEGTVQERRIEKRPDHRGVAL